MRNDIHRKSQLVPEHYDYVGSYYRGSSDERAEMVADIHDGEDVYGLDAIRASLAKRGAKAFSHPGQCAACGARFAYGSVWLHVVTNEAIDLGHECASKYALLARCPQAERDHGRLEKTAAALRERAAADKRLAEFCAKHEGLAADLAVDHHIIADIRSRVRRFGDASDKQVALVRKIAHEARNPAPAEVTVAAPVSVARVTLEGEVVSVKSVESQYGSTLKMTVKITTDAGVWLAWGTVPSGLLTIQRGDHVRFCAKLAKGRDAHFALFSRPTQAEFTAMAARREFQSVAQRKL